MFLILTILLIASASASAYVYDMTRHNRSVVVHRSFQPSDVKQPMTVTRNNIPGGYRMPVSRGHNSSQVVPNKTTSTAPVPAAAPAPAPRSLRH